MSWQCHRAPTRGQSRECPNVALPAPCTAPPCQSSAWAQPVGFCRPNVVLCTALQVSAAAKFLLCLNVTLGIQPRARCCYLCLCRDSLLPWEKLVAAGLWILQSDRNFAHSCCAHLWYQDDDVLCQVFEEFFSFFSFHLLSVLCKWISVRFVLLLRLPMLWLVWQWGCSVTMSVFAQLVLKLPSLRSQVYLSEFQKPHSAADLPSWIWHILIPFSSLPNKFCLAWSVVKFLILLGLWHFWEIFTPPSVVTCLRPVESWNE